MRIWLALCWLAVITAVVDAGDWPQILGPERNGIAQSEQLAEQWPKSGPKQVWERAVGSGYAGVAIVGQRLVVFDRHEDRETVTAVDSQTGAELWTQSYPTRYRPQIEDSDGPRCVPVIQSNRVFTFGAEGTLSAWDLETGKPLWNRKTHSEFKPADAYFGAGSTPVVNDDRIIVNVGGRNNGGIVAFDVATGKTLWASTSDAASYSSPIVAKQDETSHALILTRLHLVGLDPSNGKERFRTAFGQRGPTVNAANPVIIGDRVFLTASYGIGAKLVRLGQDSIQTDWEDDPILSSQYTTPIITDGQVYGVDGRQDGGPVTLKCFDLATRKERWKKPLTDYATLIAADGNLLVQQTDGLLRLVRLNPQKYEELDSSALFKSQTRALPALAAGKYYLRDRTVLRCFDLK